jgi:hypothetical protein
MRELFRASQMAFLNLGRAYIAKAETRQRAISTGTGFSRFPDDSLSVAKRGFTLFHKGSHAFFLVFGGKERLEATSFNGQSALQRHFKG